MAKSRFSETQSRFQAYAAANVARSEKKALAQELGVSTRHLNRILAGHRGLSSASARRIEDWLGANPWTPDRQRRDGAAQSEDGTAQEVIGAFYDLVTKLTRLADGPESERREYRRLVPGPDVGFVRALLQALLDEQRLESWRAMSTYRPG